ncbi:MAG: FAD-dependent oxidoreductase [Clostridia bacterium]|nr:FAD-dependent oxidoreductase [Clostridia bacterium]
MLYVSGIELPLEESEETAVAAALARCGLRASGNVTARIYKRAVDARKKNLRFSYTVSIETPEEEKLFRKLAGKGVTLRRASLYRPEERFGLPGKTRPVIAGFGPAGAFAALLLAERGFRPIVLERGGDVEERRAAVARFRETGILDPETNIQFGEGGAGTFSDGKLFTRVGDERCDYVLGRIEEFSGIPGLAALAHPHVGTGNLYKMMKGIRERILNLGGEIRFHEKLTDLRIENGRLRGVVTDKNEIPCEKLILAAGHSARDTLAALKGKLAMEPKGFAIGLRIEHKRRDIDEAMYGDWAGHPLLGSAEYRLVSKEFNAFTFCMCPGGTVVAAASEEGGVVTNGMSEYARDGENSNAALVVPVRYDGADPLGGIEWQRELERACFLAGGGGYAAPVQTFGDLLAGRKTVSPGSIRPTYPRGTRGADFSTILAKETTDAIIGAMGEFGRRVKGFDRSDALFTGAETRTSSPVRLTRNGNFEALGAAGVFPAGEGAGYAGGILSAAVDGIRAAERSTL